VPLKPGLPSSPDPGFVTILVHEPWYRRTGWDSGTVFRPPRAEPGAVSEVNSTDSTSRGCSRVFIWFAQRTVVAGQEMRVVQPVHSVGPNIGEKRGRGWTKPLSPPQQSDDHADRSTPTYGGLITSWRAATRSLPKSLLSLASLKRAVYYHRVDN
jgi:hypothetical protein